MADPLPVVTPAIRVSDHALVVFMERVAGCNFAPVRQMILASIERASIVAEEMGESDFTVVIARHRFIVRNGTLVTITVPSETAEQNG